MGDRLEGYQKAAHLRSGMIYLIAWLGVAVAEYRTFRDGGISRIVADARAGDYLPLLLVSASVILLTLTINSFWHYFKGPAKFRNG